MAELDIAERRVPQDGRIKIMIQGRKIDLRLNTLPVIFGEKIVMRILDQSNLNVNLESFGFQPEAQERFLKAIQNPYGMVLVTGPTGSGKTLTAFLASIDRLTTSPRPDERSHRTRVLYISPLRALAFDIEKNLRAPLTGIGLAAERLGEVFVTPEVGMRTGDTAANAAS